MKDDTVKVNYFVMRKAHGFMPITVDVYRGKEFLAAFRCRNDSLVDGGVNIGKVIFAGQCDDPTVIINSNVTISIQLDLHVMLSDQEQTCSTVIIGPQSEYTHILHHLHISLHRSVVSECILIFLFAGLELFSEIIAGQHAPFVRLLNVDSCTRVRPAVPITLTTSTNASITLHPDGGSETVGDISVLPLPCNDSHTQVYRVTVSASENDTLYGEIVDALLPTGCILIPVSGESSTG